MMDPDLPGGGRIRCGRVDARTSRFWPSCARRRGKLPAVCRRHGMSKETLRRWRAKYRGLERQEARRLKQLEDENRRLKKLVADQALDLSLMRDLVGRTW